MKKIISLLFIMILVSNIIVSDYADASTSKMFDYELFKNNIIKPMYIAHLCHDGPLHAECEWVTTIYNCGCQKIKWICCCGITMKFFEIPCDKHRE
ncbi:hypothetical protein [Caloranaerobacter ferrireducens]|uniref:hypothetical protein n=1 Tax=Caloranaerobacter ferrireducens TaxID=1323370 RepID=UPI00084DFA69|nr:hypothetical protein [Caloranaerobacter ferrireducens]